MFRHHVLYRVRPVVLPAGAHWAHILSQQYRSSITVQPQQRRWITAAVKQGHHCIELLHQRYDSFGIIGGLHQL